MYLDAAYIAKVYLNEPESEAVRALVRGSEVPFTSSLSMSEVCSVFHRHFREGWIGLDLFREQSGKFLEHIDQGVWALLPLNDRLLRQTAEFIRDTPPALFLRAGDAIHLATAHDHGEREIWTNDRRMLAAAPWFGITGRSV